MQRTYSSQNSFEKTKAKTPRGLYGKLIFDRDTKATTWGKGSFRQIVPTQLDIHMEKNEPLPYKVQY